MQMFFYKQINNNKTSENCRKSFSMKLKCFKHLTLSSKIAFSHVYKYFEINSDYILCHKFENLYLYIIPNRMVDSFIIEM